MTTRTLGRVVPTVVTSLLVSAALGVPAAAAASSTTTSPASPGSTSTSAAMGALGQAAQTAQTAASVRGPAADREGPGYVTGLPREHGHETSDGATQPPLTSNRQALRTAAPEPVAKPARPSMRTNRAPGAAAPTAVAACTSADFASKSGAALVALIKGSTTECINTLFNVQGSEANAIFREAQMATVAYALRDNAASYPGNNSTSTAQLVLFLRAGYYVQFYDPSVGTYGSSLRTAIQAGLDAYFASPRSQDVNDANGEILAEAVTLIDSSEQNARYLNVVKRLLNGYNSTYNSSFWMLSAVNNTYTVLFRGHQVPAFVQAVAADRSILDTLYNFAGSHLDLLGGEQSYLTSNAGRELARFLGDSSIKATVKPLVRGLLNQSNITGPTAALWVGVAEMTDTYDKADCAYYDTCNLASRLSAAVLKVDYVCSPSIRIKAQQMTSNELSTSCASLKAQDAYFHSVARDPGPVANDNNTSIEVVVFDSSTDYQTYAGAMFGIDTNNGGMYLEGDPAVAGNQPRFIAYEAEWVRPAFQVWNLNHEYTHYLDGRFNMYGDFGVGVSTPTIWWIEGFAEYISYNYREEPYTAAQAEARAGTYSLRTIFDNTYSNDTTRVYRWGYLASAFMINKHPNELAIVLGHYRSGNWAAARTYLTTTIGTRYDAEFRAFLAECGAGNCGGGGGGTPTNQAPTAAFTSTTSGLTATFTDGSRDTDGTIASRRWTFGDGTSSTATNPSKTYSGTGTYTVSLTVTDDKGATGTVSKSVTVTSGTPTNQAPTAAFTSTTSGLTATFTDGSRDTDGTIASRRWTFGDGTSSTATNPSKTYSGAGTYTVSLTVTDDKGATGTVSKSVTVTSGGAQLPECTSSDLHVLALNCQRSNRSAAAGDDDFMYFYVPAGKQRVTITTSGGSGNSDLYYNHSGWATPSYHVFRSTGAGNAATITVDNPREGYHYVTLHGQTAFNGVTISVK